MDCIAISARPMTTMSRFPSCTCQWRKLSRTWRFIRLRATAEPAALRDMTRPRRGLPWEFGVARTVIQRLLALLWLWSNTHRYSAGCVKRACRGKRARPQRKGADSDGQPCPALGTTCVDNCSTAFGTHARTKTMCALALQVAGLKGSFHGTPGPELITTKSSTPKMRREKGAKGTVSAARLST